MSVKFNVGDRVVGKIKEIEGLQGTILRIEKIGRRSSLFITFDNDTQRVCSARGVSVISGNGGAGASANSTQANPVPRELAESEAEEFFPTDLSEGIVNARDEVEEEEPEDESTG